ncbi:MAG: YraN family protein [Magnetococcales bacterium]|nr:YraN family protein [Magnetococcales bacterium]
MTKHQDDRKKFGRFAEDLAAGHLSRTGYHLLGRNVRFRQGELDIVALHEGVLVFCEVKARRSDAYGLPVEAVHIHKQRRMMQLGSLYLLANPEYAQHACRFDVVSVSARGLGWQVEVIQNAFP